MRQNSAECTPYVLKTSLSLHGKCKAEFVLASSAQFNLVHNSVFFHLQFQCCVSCIGLEIVCRFPSLIWIHAGQKELASFVFRDILFANETLWIECKLVLNVCWNKWKSILLCIERVNILNRKLKALQSLNAIKWFYMSDINKFN